MKRSTAIGAFSILLILVLGSALWAPPPASKVFAPFLRQYIPIPVYMQVWDSSGNLLDGVQEDNSFRYWLFDRKAMTLVDRNSVSKFLESEPGSNAKFWIEWGDGTTTNLPDFRDTSGNLREFAAFKQTTSVTNHQQLDKIYYHNTAADSYVIKLGVDYRKQTNPGELFPKYENKIERFDLRTIRVGNWPIAAARPFYFYVSLKSGGTMGTLVNNQIPTATVDEDQDVVFQANFPYTVKSKTSDPNWPYPLALPESSSASSYNSTWASDYANGIEPGSVQIRWRVNRPTTSGTGWQEYITAWSTISNQGENLPSLYGKNANAPSGASSGSGNNTFTYRFVTPFESSTSTDPQYYTVSLEVRYKYFIYTPVIVTGDLGKKYISRFTSSNCLSLGYQTLDNAMTYKNSYANCRLDSTTYNTGVTLTYPSSNPSVSLRTGSTPIRVLVKDKTKAVITLIEGPEVGTTGDPLNDFMTTFSVKDNNPNAKFEEKYLVHDYYLGSATKKVTNLAGRTLNAGDANGAHQVTTIYKQSPTTGQARVYDYDNRTNELDGFTYSTMATYTIEFGRSVPNNGGVSYKTRMPDDYAKTMDNYNPLINGGNPGDNHPLNYLAFAKIHDGQSYWIESASKSVTITDNDAPNVIISFRTDPVASYTITSDGRDEVVTSDIDTYTGPYPGILKDFPAAVSSYITYRPIALKLLGPSKTLVSIPSENDPFKLQTGEIPSQTVWITNDNTTAGALPIFYAGTRIPIWWEATDNVHGNLGLVNADLGGSGKKRFEFRYWENPSDTTASRPISIEDRFFTIERKPTTNPPLVRCEFKFFDGERNFRSVRMDAFVYELGFQPRVLETTVSGTRQKNK